ncbi:MAG: DUF5119 domain-containing protein [Muribaculaceae bacterium]|nr:DUF5119 domain-containing protein [Muribaculaceae bacterium]
MKSRHYVKFIAVTTLLVAALVSCAHKDIECPAAATGIEVLFEWNNAPDAHVDGMTLYFYPIDGAGKIWRFDIAGRDGGRVELPAGRYRMIACNNDLPGIRLEGSEKTSELTAVAARRIDASTVATTGMLYGATVSELKVTPCGVRYTTPLGTIKECVKGLVRCSPDSLSTLFTVRLTHLAGAENIRSASARIMPIASAMILDSDTPAGANEALNITLSGGGATPLLTGSGCAFALNPMEACATRLCVLVAKTDGSVVTRTIDLSPTDRNIITPHNVIISVDSLDLSEGDTPPSGDVGGIEADVAGWSTVEIDVKPSLK